MSVILPAIKSLPANLSTNLSEHQYHALWDYVSSSGLKEMRKSPQHFLSYLEYQQSGSTREDTKAMRFGRLCHAAVLEPVRMKANLVIQPDFGDMRSKGNREARDAWKATLPVTAMVVEEEELASITRVANAVLANDEIRALLEHPKTVFESTALFTHSTGILSRARFDIFNPELGVIADLKTTTDACEASFSHSIFKYKYHFQSAHYLKAAGECGYKNLKFKFIAVESSRPNSVVMYELNEGSVDYGMAEVEASFQMLARCLETDSWPSLQSFSTGTIGLPSYVFNMGNQEIF